MGRSFNAEVTARLQSSFASPIPDLPAEVKAAVEAEAKSRNCTESEALTRLVLAGQSKGGTLLQITLTPQTTYQQLKDLLKAGETIIPPNAALVVETKR